MHVISLQLCLFALASPSLAQEPEATEAPAATEAATPVARSGRMEFDERLVKGEGAAGAVYLFKRRPRALPGLVPLRRSFRDRITEPLLGDRPTPIAPVEPTQAATPPNE